MLSNNFEVRNYVVDLFNENQSCMLQNHAFGVNEILAFVEHFPKGI